MTVIECVVARSQRRRRIRQLWEQLQRSRYIHNVSNKRGLAARRERRDVQRRVISEFRQLMVHELVELLDRFPLEKRTLSWGRQDLPVLTPEALAERWHQLRMLIRSQYGDQSL